MLRRRWAIFSGIASLVAMGAFSACSSSAFSGQTGDAGGDATTGGDAATGSDARSDAPFVTVLPSCPIPSNTFGVDTLGWYEPSSGTFNLRNCFGPGPVDDVEHLPAPLEYGFAGDWQDKGSDLVASYDADAGFYTLSGADVDGGNLVFGFGGQGFDSVPLSGNWDGDGGDGIGFYIRATSVFAERNALSAGPGDALFQFGSAKDSGTPYVPLAGDWNGDGIATVGIYDPDDMEFFLTDVNDVGGANATFHFGTVGSTAFAGDWDGDGTSGIGTYDPATGIVLLRNTPNAGPPTYQFQLETGLHIVVGDWDGQ